MRKQKILTTILVLILIVLIYIIVVDLIPVIKLLITNIHDEKATITYFDKYGIKGIPLLVCLQILQVIIAFFPAAPIQTLAGVCYGKWLGTIICIVGYVIGNMLVFLVARKFKTTLSTFKPNQKKKSHLTLLKLESVKDMKNPEILIFFLYLLPVVPSGIIPHFFAESKISSQKYFWIVFIASIPSVFLCVLLGDSLMHKNYTLIVIITILLIITGILLYFFRERIIHFITRLNF